MHMILLSAMLRQKLDNIPLLSHRSTRTIETVRRNVKDLDAQHLVWWFEPISGWIFWSLGPDGKLWTFLITVLMLWKCTTTMTTYLAIYLELWKAFIWGLLTVSQSSSMIIMEGNMVAVWHDIRVLSESLYLIYKQQVERKQERV